MYLLEKVLSPAEKNSSNRISSDLGQRAILYGTVKCQQRLKSYPHNNIHTCTYHSTVASLNLII